MGWLPIASAPKDGTQVLLYFPPQTVMVTRWRGGHIGPTEDYPPADDPRWKSEEYENDPGVWLCEWVEYFDGWKLSRCDDNYYYPMGNPTHWMPLPEPPA